MGVVASACGPSSKACSQKRLPAAQKRQRDLRQARETYDRLIDARDKIAGFLPDLPHLTPVFLRLEQEIELVTAELSDDPLTRARAIAAAYLAH